MTNGVPRFASGFSLRSKWRAGHSWGEGEISPRDTYHAYYKIPRRSSKLVPLLICSYHLLSALSSNVFWWLNFLMDKGGYVYMMTNKYKTTLYIGVTSGLRIRVLKHRRCFYPDSFTAKYNLTYCIYFEHFISIQEAIKREKELKKWRREKKNQLINTVNPAWNDLWGKIQKK